MADEAKNTEELLLTDTVEPEAPEVAENPDEGGEEEEVFAFGDESAEPEAETPTIKHMRGELNKAHKRIKELEQSTVSAPQPIEVGPEPTLEDYDYDGDKFREAVREYDKRVAAAEKQKRSVTDAQEAEKKAWDAKLARIEEEKAALAKPDVDDAFATVREALSTQQQAYLVEATEGSTAKLIYALAQHPTKLGALAGETNPVRFIKEVAKLEGQLKMVKRRAPIDPDTPVRGSGAPSVAVNAAQKQLDKMEAEWAKRGGDRTHIQKFKREHNLK
jgi:hypothetical protein